MRSGELGQVWSFGPGGDPRIPTCGLIAGYGVGGFASPVARIKAQPECGVVAKRTGPGLAPSSLNQRLLLTL